MSHTPIDPNRKSHQNSLEEWLQLPESQQSESGDTEHATERSGDTQDPGSFFSGGFFEHIYKKNEFSQDISAEINDEPGIRNPELEMFPVPKAEVNDKGTCVAVIDLPTEIKKPYDPKELSRLEAILTKEFSDTLSGPNATVGPLGLIFIILGFLGWMSIPILKFFRIAESSQGLSIWIMIGSVIFVLAGIHLMLYWVAHKGSNAVKTKELDRLITERRVTHPCLCLDCVETALQARRLQGQVAGSDKSTLKSADDLRWRCSFYEIDLEGLPICVVCERYQPGEIR
jgi:hypothetical protein